MPDYSLLEPAVATFVVLPVFLVLLLLWGATIVSGGSRTSVLGVALAATAWMAGTWLAAARGVFRAWDATPPPFALLVVGIVVLAVVLAGSRLGRGLATQVPLWALVLVQAFRLPLELSMHAMYERGIMPVQMSFSGRNFDIVTGATALLVAAIVHRRRSPALVAAWNVMGLMLVVNVVVIGIASTPRFRAFGDNQLNVWVTYPPFVWLPAVLVLAAFSGHLLIFRRLASDARRETARLPQ